PVPWLCLGTRWQAKRPARDIGRRTGPPGQARSCFTRLQFREKGKAEVGRSEGGQPVTQEGEGASPAACSRARSLSVGPASLLRQGIRESFFLLEKERKHSCKWAVHRARCGRTGREVFLRLVLLPQDRRRGSPRCEAGRVGSRRRRRRRHPLRRERARAERGAIHEAEQFQQGQGLPGENHRGSPGRCSLPVVVDFPGGWFLTCRQQGVARRGWQERAFPTAPGTRATSTAEL